MVLPTRVTPPIRRVCRAGGAMRADCGLKVLRKRGLRIRLRIGRWNRGLAAECAEDAEN